jgi:vancomycin resistance protein YoaR
MMRRLARIAALAPLVVAVVLALWFAVDEHMNVDEVATNVTLEGVSVGRFDGTALDRAITTLTESAAATPVTVTYPRGKISTTAGELGLVVDDHATARTVLDIGRQGSAWSRFVSWLRSPWSPRRARLAWSFRDGDAGVLEHLDQRLRLAPVEPMVKLDGGAFGSTSGVPGMMLDAGATMSQITESLVPGVPLNLVVDSLVVPPTTSDEVARAAADRLNRLTERGVTVRLLDTVGRLSPGTLRANLVLIGDPADPVPGFDRAGLQEALLRVFADVSEPGTKPIFDVVAGAPVVVTPGSPPSGCCGSDAGRILVEALERRSKEPVDIPATTIGDPTLDAWAMGKDVVALVGEFTTNHACCEARVTNIHRIADLVRGQVLNPGESFSINDFVGERTKEEGFVEAGVIERGRFSSDVGGGISQFATTFFNAGFFGGLDLDEYQSHSIYISRYPYGREATLSFPFPDLRVTNVTAFPILIWTSYTDTSITVSLFSTPNVIVTQTGQQQQPFGKCTDVETFRRRVFADGTVVEDSVKARYRPGEGLDCNGNPTSGG